MTLIDAIMIAEGDVDETDYAEYIEAWQMLHDTGLAYRLQGYFGRVAKAMLESGEIK